MNKIAILVSLAFLAPITAYADKCNYDALSGTEYRMTDKIKVHILPNFMVNPKGDKYSQSNEKKYKSLQNNAFKVLSTDYVTTESSTYLKEIPAYKKTKANERYREIVKNEKAYTLDRSFNIELLTSDCVKYYYIPDNVEKSFDGYFIKTDGTANTAQDFVTFLGKSLQPATIKSNVKYDDFDKKYEIKTDFFNDQMIRGYSETKKGALSAVQIYMELTFLGEWAFIDSAKDRNGVSHTVVSIDRKPDCSNKYLCKLKETIAINVDEAFLRQNTNGFELKLSGKESKVVFVSAELVNAFLNEVDTLRR